MTIIKQISQKNIIRNKAESNPGSKQSWTQMNRHQEIMIGWEYLLETSLQDEHRVKSNYSIPCKVHVIGSCKMDKYCNGSVASLARALITRSTTSIKLLGPSGEGCCQWLTETWVRLRISRLVCSASVPAANKNTKQFGGQGAKAGWRRSCSPWKRDWSYLQVDADVCESPWSCCRWLQTNEKRIILRPREFQAHGLAFVTWHEYLWCTAGVPVFIFLNLFCP